MEVGFGGGGVQSKPGRVVNFVQHNLVLRFSLYWVRSLQAAPGIIPRFIRMRLCTVQDMPSTEPGQDQYACPHQVVDRIRRAARGVWGFGHRV